MKTQLLASFTTKSDLDKTIKNISDSYIIAFGKIYVVQNEDHFVKVGRSVQFFMVFSECGCPPLL